MNDFESPLEQLFNDQLRKRMPKEAELLPQFDVKTLCGNFRLDLLAVVQNRRIGIEIDGKEFHDQYRDEWRDAMILGDGRADEIVRFRGCDLHYHLDDCFYLLSKIQPLLFTARHTGIIERLASDRARRRAEGEYDWATGAMLTYGYIDDSRGVDFIDIRRNSVDGVPYPFWKVYYNYAVEHGGGPLDQLMEHGRHEAAKPARCVNC
jgi:very-short-patch-repair endonuclease